MGPTRRLLMLIVFTIVFVLDAAVVSGQNPVLILSEYAGLCLDIPNFGRPPHNGDYVQVYQCHDGDNQYFSLRGDGTIRTDSWGGFCLDVPNFGRDPLNGDRLQIYQCNNGINQRFNIHRDDSTIHSQWLDLCLDVPMYNRPAQNGDRIQVYNCNGGINQQFVPQQVIQ